METYSLVKQIYPQISPITQIDLKNLFNLHNLWITKKRHKFTE